MTAEENKILILEDNPGDFFLIKEFLKRTNLPRYQIYHAERVNDALQLLSTHSFKLILMDLFLPDGEGIQTFEKIIPQSGHIPIIVLTGLVDEQVTLDTLKKGAQDYLVKGEYDEKLLEKTIRYAVERKQNQELLKKSEEEYKLLFQNNPLPMYAFDVTTFRIHTVNTAATSFYGYSKEEFSYLSLRDIRPKEDLPRFERELIPLLKSHGIVRAGEWRHLRKDGSVVYVEIVNHDIVINDIPSKLAVIYDLTERKKVENHLRLLESVITNTNDAVLITEAEPIEEPGPKIVYANEAFTRMTGYTMQEVLGKTPRILQGPRSDREQLKKIKEAMKKWQGADVELINYRKNGDPFWSSFSVVPVADEKGWYTHWVSIQRDVTTRRQLEETTRQRLERLVDERTQELNLALKKEKQLAELKSQFVAIASHEFRTPLSTINFATNYLQQYLDKIDKEDIQNKLKKIEKQVEHMNALLEDVILAGRSDISKIPVLKSDIKMRKLMERIVEEVNTSTKNSHTIRMDYQLTSDVIYSDEKLLRNILINLLTNAIKFSPGKKFVDLHLSQTDREILIKVSDSGIGISKEDQTRLFEAFFRGANVSSISGTGLGLSIVKKAAEALGGQIQIVSEENVGTTISILLPR